MGDTRNLAEGYTLVNDTQSNLGLDLINKLQIKPGQAILDVGCGPGNLTGYLADLTNVKGKVVGIDPSRERISIAQQTAELHQKPNLSFEVGIAEDLSRFETGSFDVVFVNSTLHWVQDQPKAIREFGRVLKSGGKLGISGGSGDFVAAHETIKAEVLSRKPYSAYPIEIGPKFLKRHEIEVLLDSGGFSQRELTNKEIVKWARDGEAMVNWLDTSSSGKTYGGIPLELRPQAKEEMKKEWTKLTTEEGINMRMLLLVTIAIRN